MIDATSQADKLTGYRNAYFTAKGIAESDWHPAWLQYHEYATRRPNGRPILPTTDESTSVPGAGTGNRLDPDRQIAVNHIQSVERTIVASTLNRNPSFTLEPMFPGFEAQPKARLGACALNFVWRKEKFNDPIREAYLDSLDYGRGWIKVGWQSSMTRPIAGDTPSGQLADALKAVNDLSRRGARLGHASFTPEEVQRHLTEFGGKLLVEDKPTVRRISPFDMFWDPMATDPMDARWIANRWRCPLAWAQQNSDWQPKARNVLALTDLEASSDPEMNVATAGGTNEYEGKDTVWIVDFFDLGEGTWCQFTENGTDYLRKPSDIPFTFGQPFYWIENIDDTASQHPISEVEVLWPFQRDLTEITMELGLDRIQSRPKIAVRREDAEQLRPLLESRDQGMVVEVDIMPGEGQGLDQVIKHWKPDSNAQILMAQLNKTAQDITMASGVSDYLRAGGGLGETATEVNAKQTAAANFMGEKSGRLRDFIQGTAQRVFMMMQTWSRLPYYVSTKGADPADGNVKDVTVQFGRAHMQGAYEVIVGADSMETKTPQAKAARAQAIASTAIPFMQAGVVDPAKLFSYVMKEGFDVTDPTLLLTQQAYQPPQQQPPPGTDQTQAPPGAVGPMAGVGPAGPSLGGISMTPGTSAGQLGATAAVDRAASGATIPQPQ